jgi:hypothetical protein
MPTNILRRATDQRKPRAKPARGEGASRLAVLTAGGISVRIELAATATAELVWQALPLYSSAETWGRSIKFETPLELGRDRTARLIGSPGEIYFWIEDDRIIVPFGPTPISRPGECRLPSPANVIGWALDDVTVFEAVQPGAKVSLTVA